jgi:hypothetical protein
MVESRCRCSDSRWRKSRLMGKKIDLTGKKVGYLTAIKRSRDASGTVAWECLCECGKTTFIRTNDFTRGIRKSCGCARDYFISKTLSRHGCYKDRLYRIWEGMRRRCSYKKDQNYKHYGGRGIKVCEEWETDFVNFREWAIDNGYEENLTIDRIDCNGNYEPDNCRWATMKEQLRNTRRNHYITFNGERKLITDWANELDISLSGIYKRINRGVPEKYLLLERKELKEVMKHENE